MLIFGLPVLAKQIGLQYHKEMKVSRQEDGRENQKRRTRRDIVTAANELLRNGTVPSVTAAARAAGVSRATAYRYFPTRESLLFEIGAVTPSVESVEEALTSLEGTDPEARLGALVSIASRTIFSEEAHMRMALRLYQDQWIEERLRDRQAAPVVREGRRMRWLDEALAPLKPSMGEAKWRRLRAALALTIGVEALSVMKDVCRIDDEEAFEVLRWAALALLRAGMGKGPPGE
jgi:AcrR family transcriptional regulator